MKLLRFGNAGEEKPGLIDQSGKIRDLSSVIDDINGNTIAPESLDKLKIIKLKLGDQNEVIKIWKRWRGKTWIN